MNEQLAAQLREWSTNCLIDGLRMKRGQRTLQELLARAADALSDDQTAR